MEANELVTVLTSTIEGSAMVTFLWFFIRGLKKEIHSLNKTIEVQNKTLEAMEKRIVETEKIGHLYRNLLQDLPEDIQKYKVIIGKLKDEVIKELQDANAQKDAELEELSRLRLEQLELQEKMLGELPKLKADLESSLIELNQRIKAIGAFNIVIFSHWSSKGDKYLWYPSFLNDKDDFWNDKLNTYKFSNERFKELFDIRYLKKIPDMEGDKFPLDEKPHDHDRNS
jgi:hypothetical protein